jgi:gamma-glutamyl-gamma-aminobutyrate hydrolase PuuD
VHDRPLIAVNGLLEPGERPALKLANRYAEAVHAAGGVPVAIPPVGGADAIAALLARVDGLLLTGGDDFAMERLGKGPTHPAAKPTPGEKQDFDVALARAALARDLPVLGICYGMQLLALVGGGDLFQHLPADRPGAREHSGGTLHGVRVEPGTKLAAAIGLEQHRVVSRHHQAVAAVAGGWRVCARDDEGLIEAIEHAARAFALGVQWHPESGPAGGADGRLFRALVDAARHAVPKHA